MFAQIALLALLSLACLVTVACGRGGDAPATAPPTDLAALAQPAASITPVVETATATATATPEATAEATPVATPAPPPPFVAQSAVVALATASHASPSMSSPAVRQLAAGTTVHLAGLQYGENWMIGTQDWVPVAHDWERIWYRLDDGSYVYRAFVLLASDGIPSARAAAERYVVVDLSQQMAWAMEGSTVMRAMPVTTGKSGFETPAGEWGVLARVASERMTSASAGFDGDTDFYDVQRVLYTQYFAQGGFAMHLNYWQPANVFGNVRTSHGCIGMRLPDAQYLWLFGGYDMRVIVRERGGATPVAARATPQPTPEATPPASTPTPAPIATPLATSTPTAMPTITATPIPTPLPTPLATASPTPGTSATARPFGTPPQLLPTSTASPQ